DDTAGQTLHAVTLLRNEEALRVDAKRAHARRVDSAVGGVLHDKVAAARDAEVCDRARGRERTLRVIRRDAAELHARADARGRRVGAAATRRRGRRGLENVTEAVRVFRVGGLEAGRVDVGDVVADDFEPFLKRAQRADAAVHGADE